MSDRTDGHRHTMEEALYGTRHEDRLLEATCDVCGGHVWWIDCPTAPLVADPKMIIDRSMRHPGHNDGSEDT